MSRDSIQARFAAALLDPGAVLPDGLARHQGGTPTHRFGIYRNNVTVTLIEVLRTQFPATERLLGEERFRFLARQYLRHDPPRTPVLLTYGERFADFLDLSEHVSRHRFISDVTRIEYEWGLSYHAADAVPLLPETLSAIAPERLGKVVFAWHPAARLVSSRYAAVSIFLDNRKAEEPPTRALVPAEDGLVTRPALDVRIGVLAAGEYAFLDAIRSGRTFEDAAASGFAAGPEFDISRAVATMIAAGAVTSVRVSDVISGN